MNASSPVKQAAILDDEDIIHTLPRPARHCDILRFMHKKGTKGSFLDGQGFILNDDTFVHRSVAAKIALRLGQVKALAAPPDLYSEDLW